MRYLYLLCFTSLFALTACFPELTEDVAVVPEEEVTTDDPVVTDDFNFAVPGGEMQFDHAYRHTTELENGRFRHHLVLTRDDVRDGDYLTGSSPAIDFFIVTETDDLIGRHLSGDTSGEIGAEDVRYFNNLRTGSSNTNATVALESGSIVIDQGGSDYEITVEYRTAFSTGIVNGVYRGTIEEVIPSPATVPTAEDFQGNNVFARGESEIPLRYAYLYKRSANRYTLAVTEHPVADDNEEELTGVSTAMMVKMSGSGALSSGVYGATGTATGSDFLGADGIKQSRDPLYCTNYNFFNGDFTDDEDTEGETLILVEDGEVMIRFTGTILGTDLTTTALYRGELTVID